MVGVGKVIRVGGFNLSTLSSSILGIRQGGLDTLMKPLFANGEQGFAYDPNDLSTLYQDAAGTIPVTSAGQPVGLMLDKSEGLVLGVNTLINGDFSQGSVGWTLADGVTVENSQLNFNTTSGVLALQAMPPLVVGKWYVVEFDLVSYTSGTPRFFYGTTQYPSISTVTGRKKYIVSPIGRGNFGFTCISSGAVFSVNNISVKELAGSHAFQSVSASRPILQQTPILGSELIQDTEFNNPAYWNVSPSVNVSGGFVNFAAATSGNYISRMGILTLGKTYQLTFTISSRSNGSISPSISLGTGSISLGNFNTAGTYTVNAVASGAIPTIQLTAIGTTNATVDNISVKEVIGYHTNQNYLKFDGVDDKLTTTLPTQLTGCTVVRSVPNVGTQILTGQTIPTPYEDNTDHCGLIVINRALTPSETSAIAAEFNKRAGV